MSGLPDFVRESNRIEGILREPTPMEVACHDDFLAQPDLTVEFVCEFVDAVAGAKLRDQAGMNVRVGNHFPPRGGPDIRDQLAGLVAAANGKHLSPYALHIAYEQLHPFMDGNGRSGRAIWAWQMKRDGASPFSLPFLHRFYYQALDASRP